MKISIFILILIVSVSDSAGQKNNDKKLFTLTGKVTDESGAAINRVSVIIKGKTNGTMSSSQGTFILSNVSNGDTVTFTHVAYQPATIVIKGNNLLNVEMKRGTYHSWSFELIDTATKIITRQVQDTKEKLILTKVEVKPSFRGGRDSLSRYFRKVIKYPKEAANRNIEGEIVVGFIVGRDGEIKDVRLVKGISPDCDRAVIDAVTNMPNWISGIQNGVAVEVYVQLSFSFSLFFTRDS
jgi:TonB family protein